MIFKHLHSLVLQWFEKNPGVSIVCLVCLPSEDSDSLDSEDDYCSGSQNVNAKWHIRFECSAQVGTHIFLIEFCSIQNLTTVSIDFGFSKWLTLPLGLFSFNFFIYYLFTHNSKSLHITLPSFLSLMYSTSF